MSELFPTISSEHWKHAIAQARATPNKVMGRIREAVSSLTAPAPIIVERTLYVADCEKRWYDAPLANAIRNYAAYREVHETLVDAMRQFRRDPFQTDLNGKCHNPTGHLTEFLWKLAEAVNEDKSRLYPFLDFEEHHQKVFLRRGLVIYCKLILSEIENRHIIQDPCLPLFPETL